MVVAKLFNNYIVVVVLLELGVWLKKLQMRSKSRGVRESLNSIYNNIEHPVRLSEECPQLESDGQTLAKRFSFSAFRPAIGSEAKISIPCSRLDDNRVTPAGQDDRAGLRLC
jgi:hypothetical protein